MAERKPGMTPPKPGSYMHGTDFGPRDNPQVNSGDDGLYEDRDAQIGGTGGEDRNPGAPPLK